MTPENTYKYMKFQLDEARWIDSVVKEFIPKTIEWMIERSPNSAFGRALRFLIGYVYIGKILGITVTRNQDTSIIGGKGFRQGIDHGYEITAIRSTILKRGDELAKRRFKVGIIIKQ